MKPSLLPNEVAGIVLISISAISSFITAILLIQSVVISDYRQLLAFRGDSAAAKRIILPCYRPLLIFSVCLFFILFLFQGMVLFAYDRFSNFFVYQIIRLHSVCLVAVFSIVPMLFTQRSISVQSFIRTVYFIFPIWAISCLLLITILALQNPSYHTILWLELIFMFIDILTACILSIGILTGILKSRVQLGSVSNRNAVELLLLYSIIFFIIIIVEIGLLHKIFEINSNSNVYLALSILLVILSFISSCMFPFATYRSLLADTKYWRGLGKHNQGGLVGTETVSQYDGSSLSISSRPSATTIDLSVASTSMQQMLAETNHLAIDFAFVQLHKVIGTGSTSEVHCGRFGKALVAIKVSTPPEITAAVVETFAHEAKICAKMKHKNIVKFYGICIRPPEIGMVFELCEGGNLKVNLQQDKAKWSKYLRLRACLNAAEALCYIHSKNFIHRDIKAENFMVTGNMVVKLADFGETTVKRSEESTKIRRMSVVGTISHMAPELISGARYYTQSVDIYALAFTFWEIWTGNTPYAELNQFDIYKEVNFERRPNLPEDAPVLLKQWVAKCWQQDALLRPSAENVTNELKSMISDLKMTQQNLIGIELPRTSFITPESHEVVNSTDDVSSTMKSPSNLLSISSSSSLSQISDGEARTTTATISTDFIPKELPDPNNKSFFIARTLLRIDEYFEEPENDKQTTSTDGFWFRKSTVSNVHNSTSIDMISMPKKDESPVFLANVQKS